MRKLSFTIVTLVALSLVACNTTSTTSNVTPTPVAPVPSAPSTTSADITAALPLIQSAANIATGAVLQFTQSNATQRTTLANQIYSAANAINSLSTGTIPTPAVITSTVLSFGGTNADASYASYASSLGAIYSSYYTKLAASGNGALAVSVLQALAAGAQAGASVYTSVPVPAPATAPATTTP